MEGVVIIEAAAMQVLTDKIDRIEEIMVAALKRLEEVTSKWMTLEETCFYLRKSPSWLYQNKSKIGFSKVDGSILFSRKIVDTYIESMHFQST